MNIFALKHRRNLIISGLLLVMVGCNQDDGTVQPSTTKQIQENVGAQSEPEASVLPDDTRLMQDEADLIAGVSRAICYSGFRSGQHPDRGDGAVNPSYDEALEDLKILSRDSNFELIRMYDSGENSETVLKAISENDLDIKVMLGIWLKAEISNHENCSWLNDPIPDETLEQNKKSNLAEIAKGIKLANAYPEIIVAVNVGNEALIEWTDHKVDTQKVIGYVKQVQESIEQPVTVAENFKWWADKGQELAEAVDFVAVHVYPIWEDKDIHEAMYHTLENLLEVRAALPGKPLVISEAGWATVASEFGARASEDKQQRYYQELMSWSAKNNITTFFFEAFDEDWKGDPKNWMGAEKHWGIFSIDRKAKKVMHQAYPDLR